MSLTDSRLIDGYGKPLSTISCSVFDELYKDKTNKKQLDTYYLRKPLGVDEYYNKLLECTNKNKSMYERKLKMLRDPRYMNDVSKNNLEITKQKEAELRLNIRKTKKTLKNICTKKRKFFCRLTENKIKKILNSQKKEDILKVKQFNNLKTGIDVCNNNNICMDFRISISDIAKNTIYFYKTLSKTFLDPIIKSKNSIMSSKKENTPRQPRQPRQPGQNKSKKHIGKLTVKNLKNHNKLIKNTNKHIGKLTVKNLKNHNKLIKNTNKLKTLSKTHRILI